MFLFRTKSEERRGEQYAFLSALLIAIFPVVIHYASGVIPPTFFASLTTLTAAVFMMFLMTFYGRWKELQIKAAWIPMVMVTLFIVVLPLPLIYNGTRLTSGINTSILLTTEIFFALLFTHFSGETITLKKTIGGIAIILGTVFTLTNGHFTLNAGDLMIVLATALHPIGNLYAKKVLALVSPITLVFVRSLLGGLALLAISFLSESIFTSGNQAMALAVSLGWLILLNGILLSAVSKLVWYQALKRLQVGKAVIIVMSYPSLSMILSVLFLKEIPTLYQLGGLLIIFAGLTTITYHERSKVQPNVG